MGGNKRQATGQAFIKDDTDGPDVRTTVEAMGLATHLLGADVVRRSCHFAGPFCRQILGDGQAEVGHTRLAVPRRS